jgi:hypothetical protein
MWWYVVRWPAVSIFRAILRVVYQIITNVSEERAVSIFGRPTLKMEAAGFSETMIIIYHATCRHILEDSNLNYDVLLPSSRSRSKPRKQSADYCTCLAYSSNLRKEVVSSYETSVNFYQITRRGTCYVCWNVGETSIFEQFRETELIN